MSSADLISLCILRIEINDEKPDSEDVASSNVMRSQREPHEIKVKTYPNRLEKPELDDWGLIPANKRIINQKMTEQKTKEKNDGPKEIEFLSGNPFVETTKGILHLYKNDTLSLTSDSKTLCLIGIPASMNCNDLLTFTAPCHANIGHLRIIRDSTPNQYMAILTFRCNESAKEFYNTYNETSFNNLEPDFICRAVWVSKVEWSTDGNPPPGHTELPICPVCLERMDESVDGVLTILCNHSFHASCLVKWSDSTCPVCRCVQSPEMAEQSECMQCGLTSNTGGVGTNTGDSLWICLICGHIGCGRYQGGHAASHYRASGHCYALQLGSNRVWDYKGDNFVHRLLQNKSDGKLVATSQPSTDETGMTRDAEEKIDSVQLEFTYLLTSQLDAQRQYFEDKLARLESSAIGETEILRQKISQSIQSNSELENKLTVLTKEKAALEKKINQLNSRLSTLQSELNDEKQLGKALRNNQQQWQNRLSAAEEKYKQVKATKEKEIVELKEQLRDVMFYIDAQQVIDKSEHKDEIQEGQVTVGETTNKKSKNRKKR